MDQVVLTGLGYVEFEWEDQGGNHKVRWRRPKLREYRELRNLLRERAQESNNSRQAMTAKLGELQAHEQGNEVPEGFDRDEWWDQVDRLRDEVADYMIPWVKRADQILADGEHLPEDENDWPTWMATASLPTDVIDHWRRVPLAPGSKGSNNPPASPTSQ